MLPRRRSPWPANDPAPRFHEFGCDYVDRRRENLVNYNREYERHRKEPSQRQEHDPSYRRVQYVNNRADD